MIKKKSARWMIARFLSVAMIAAGFWSITHAQSHPRISVGPNVLVSRETDGVSFEVSIAADPVDPSILVGTSAVGLTANPAGHGGETRTHYSRDGGYTWNTTRFADLVLTPRALDPQIAFTRARSSIHMNYAQDRVGGRNYVFRSADGGLYWEAPYQGPPSMDHPQIAADLTTGRFGGNLYVAGYTPRAYLDSKQAPLPGHPKNDSHILVYRSADEGRTWSGPVSVADRHAAGGRGGVQSAVTPLVFSDGTLFVPYMTWEEEERTLRRNRFEFCLSVDGGESFSGCQAIKSDRAEHSFGGTDAYAFYAIDRSDGPFRDRIYMVWAAALRGEKGEVGRIHFTYSADRGKTWASPKPVSPNLSDAANQFEFPAIAVNNQGIVAIMWVDDRAAPLAAHTGSTEAERTSKQLIDRYMIASIDGGRTFLPETRLTSESSSGSNRHIGGVRSVDGIGVQPASKFGEVGIQGGHYAGLTAGADGVFHPLWADHRTGRLQVWTARVRVEKSVPELPTGLEETDIIKMVDIHYDPLREFPPDGTIEIPVRLRNRSNKPVYGPITIEMVAARGGAVGPVADLLNSTNGKTGVGAVMDYSRSLGGFPSLEPGGITEAVVWRFKKQADLPVKASIRPKGRVVKP